MTLRASIAILGALLIGACGGDDGDGNGDFDGGTDDAAPADAEVNTCTVLEPSYGDLGAKTGTAIYAPQDEGDPGGLQFLQLQIPLNQESPPDVLFIELYEDAAPFEPNLATGTFTIIDDQTSVITCGTCVFIGADFDDPMDIDFHAASSGAVAIDTLDLTPGTGIITGSLANVRMRRVVLGGGGQQEVAGACKTTVDAVSFDFTVSLPPAIAPSGRVVRHLRLGR